MFLHGYSSPAAYPTAPTIQWQQSQNAKIRHINGPGILPFRSLMLPILFSATGGDLEKEKGWAC